MQPICHYRIATSPPVELYHPSPCSKYPLPRVLPPVIHPLIFAVLLLVIDSHVALSLFLVSYPFHICICISWVSYDNPHYSFMSHQTGSLRSFYVRIVWSEEAANIFYHRSIAGGPDHPTTNHKRPEPPPPRASSIWIIIVLWGEG